MSLAAEFEKMAIELAKELHQKTLGSQKELQAMQARMAQIKTELDAAKLASQRAGDFKPLLNGEPQCPRCWTLNATSTSMTPIPGNDREDLFRCHTCHFEISIPA